MNETNLQTEPGGYVTTYGIPIRNVWHMLLYVWDAWHLSRRLRSAVENAPSLDGLMASVLSALLRQRLRTGLGRDYRQERSVITGIRGRVDFAQSQKKLAFQHGRACCRYDSFGLNVPKNQIIRSTLARLIQLGDFGPVRHQADRLRAELRQLVRRLEPVDLVELKPAHIRREQLGRNDGDYRVMLAVCGLILQRQMPLDAPGVVAVPGVDRDTLTLHQVYERFVATVYRVHLSAEWRVIAQPKIEWPTPSTSPYLPVMQPDVIMQHRPTGRLVVLDTKFTAGVLVRGRRDNLVFDRSHLYQIYAYLRSQEHCSDNHRTATGILLYPTVDRPVSEVARIQGHDIRWETIDLGRPWEKIEDHLLELPARVLGAAAGLSSAVFPTGAG